MNDLHWHDQLRDHLRTRTFILAGEVLAGTTAMAQSMRRMGVQRLLCVGIVPGVGRLPAEDGEQQLLLDLPLPNDMMGSIHEGERLLRDPPDWVQVQVDRFDPDRQARVIAPFFATGAPQLGRPVWGARQPAWVALEDKVVCDAAFEAAGVPVAPWRVVPVERAALLTAAALLDRGAGTVWAGDAREGFNGGASMVRWVRSPDDVDGALALLNAHCDRARVMPFLDGIPCSIHGMVLPDGSTLAFRPCEMLVLRRPAAPYFAYAQAATTWDPPSADRAQMRDLARRMGRWLRDTHGYRGVFTIDGVMTADCFLPTELNPRFGAALGVIGRNVQDIPLLSLHFAAIEGLDMDWQGDELEARVVAAADGQRHAGFAVTTATKIEGSRSFGLVQAEGEWRLSLPDEEPHAEGIFGPAASCG
jgi:hypothetical protein